MKKNNTMKIILISLVALITLGGCKNNNIDISALTGATPIAVTQNFPDDLELNVTGMVKQNYRFTSKSLQRFASLRIRTREVNGKGEFMGAYIYYGIQVLHIMEGIKPVKPEGEPFDRPLDIVVGFRSKSGAVRFFSYGELTMTTDKNPVTLAFQRDPIDPSKDAKNYTKNKYREPLKGFRLICPGDRDDSRYLNDIVEIFLTTTNTEGLNLPKTIKDASCVSSGIVVLQNGNTKKLSFSGVEKASTSNWIRVGHGRGYKGVSKASGYSLKSLIKNNFSEYDNDSYFLFVACDGYRSIFSGHEIFNNPSGISMMVVQTIDGKSTRGNLMLAPVDDYFADRDIWGLSHIVLLSNDSIKKSKKD